MEVILITKSEEETKELGYKLGRLLKPYDVICLEGDLGSGKTAFTKGIALGLEIKENITSPTYTIVNEYFGRIPLYHFDVYRLDDEEELYNIGFEEYINEKEGVIVIEWADLVKALIPEKRLWIRFRYLKGNDREITFIPKGERYIKLMEELRR